MLTLRARIFIIISVVVLIILGISVALLLARRHAATPANQTTPTSTTNSNTTANGSNPVITQPLQTPVQNSVPTGLQIKPRTSVEATQSGVKQFAQIFIERYATYSTDSHYQNIRDVQALVTTKLWSTLSTKIGTVATSTPFTGVTTQVVTTSLVDWKDDAATVELKTQQITTQGAAQPITSYATFKVRLVKQGTNWLVDTVEKTS